MRSLQKVASIDWKISQHSRIIYYPTQGLLFFQQEICTYQSNRSQGSFYQQLRLQLQSHLNLNNPAKMDLQKLSKLVFSKLFFIEVAFIKSRFLDKQQSIIFFHLEKLVKKIHSCFERDQHKSYIPYQNRDLYSFKLYLNPINFDELLQIYDLIKDSNLLKISPFTVQEENKKQFSYTFMNINDFRNFLFKTVQVQKIEAQNESKEENQQWIMQSQNFVFSFYQENQYLFPRAFCLKKINSKLRQQHLLSIKPQWDSGFDEFLRFINQHWQQYYNIYEQELKTFVLINLYKIHKLSLNTSGLKLRPSLEKITCFYQTAYPNIIYLIYSFCSKLNLKDEFKLLYEEEMKASLLENHQKLKNRSAFKRSQNEYSLLRKVVLQQLQKTLNIKENIVDQIFLYYVEDQKAKSNILTKITLDILTYQAPKIRQQIKNINDFCQGLSQISDLLSSIFYSFNGSINQANLQEKCPIILEQIEDIRFFQSCLCCSQFFYTNVNIYDDSISKMPVYLFPTITRLKEIEVQLKDRICFFSNSGGGVILFNCIKSDRFIYAKGDKTSQKNKEQYQQRIQSYIKQFYPRLELNKHIIISFVPIVQIQKQRQMEKYTGWESEKKKQKSHMKQKCLKAVYVTRIIVNPIDPSILYFWSFPSNYHGYKEDNYYCQIKFQQKEKTLEMKQLARHIKKKMKFYIPDYVSREERQLLIHPSTYFDHEIITPDAGQFLSVKINSHEDQRENKYKDPQLQYREMSLLVVDLKYIEKISLILRQRIQCVIHPVFSKLGYKLAKKSAIIYHNIRFQQLLDQLYNNRKLIFNQKRIIAIHITAYLKFTLNNKDNPFQEGDFTQIVELFTSKCQNQNVKIYKFIKDNQHEFYCQTQTKMSSVLLYYMMNQFKKKLMFKNPVSLDKLSPLQRQKSFILLFESKPVNKNEYDILEIQNENELYGFVKGVSYKNRLDETCFSEIII